MPFEIIRRKEGELNQKQDIRHEHTQFSINSYGHLYIREFDDQKSEGDCALGRGNCSGDITKVCWSAAGHQCENYKQIRIDDEHLLVLDKPTTENLIRFIFENRSTYELKELLKDLIANNNKLPF